MDWLKALDFDLALANVKTDVLGDWYRDPWNWCELDWLVPTHVVDYAVPRLNATGVKSVAKLDVAKENFAIRPAVVLDPLDRLIYQALVDCLSLALLRDVPAWVYGWRLPVKGPKRGIYAKNAEEWQAFRDHLKRLANYDTVALTTDIVSFFVSIPSDVLAEQITERGKNEPAERLADMTTSWSRSSGRGLPQRSAASAALAHMYLGPLDVVLERYNEIPGGAKRIIPEGRTLRWMDDIWVFGRTADRLREAQIALQKGIRDIGLEMNFGKTKLLRGADVGIAVHEIEHSAVDSGLNDDVPDVTPLDDLIDEVLASPELVDRTTIHFMTTRMRTHSIYDRVDEIGKATRRMPHAPDHLARLFFVTRVIGMISRSGTCPTQRAGGHDFLGPSRSLERCSLQRHLSTMSFANSSRRFLRQAMRRYHSHHSPRSVWRPGTQLRPEFSYAKPRRQRRIPLHVDRSRWRRCMQERRRAWFGRCFVKRRRTRSRWRCSRNEDSRRARFQSSQTLPASSASRTSPERQGYPRLGGHDMWPSARHRSGAGSCR